MVAAVTFLVALSGPPTSAQEPTPAPLKLRIPRPTEPPAKADPAWIDAAAKPVTPAQLAKVKPTLPLREFFTILGPASSNPCSGMHCWQWRCTDGRTLLISAADPKPGLKPFGFVITNRRPQ